VIGLLVGRCRVRIVPFVRVSGVPIILALGVLALPGSASGQATPVSGGGWQVDEQITLTPQVLGPVDEFVALSSTDRRPRDGSGIPATLLDLDRAGSGSECTEADWPIDSKSIQWAPDSTALAFPLTGLPDMVDSDIFVYEVATGYLSNLTDDDHDGALPLEVDELDSLPIDTLPVWSPDSQTRTFVRIDWALDLPPSELWTVVRRGGEPQRRHVASEDTPFAITTPMFHLDDGALLHTISTMFLVDSADGLGLLDTDGSIRKIMPGKTDDAFPMPVATDAIRRGEYTLVPGYSAQRLALGHLKDPLVFDLVVETGETLPLGTRSLADGTLSPVRFTPTAGSSGCSGNVASLMW
jgi:hypothetical protein